MQENITLSNVHSPERVFFLDVNLRDVHVLFTFEHLKIKELNWTLPVTTYGGMWWVPKTHI